MSCIQYAIRYILSVQTTHQTPDSETY